MVQMEYVMGVNLKMVRGKLLGRALSDYDQSSQKLSVLWGLPLLASDAISSVAYATEEILLVLIPVLGAASYSPMLGVTAAIIGLLLILVMCYRQTIDAYPQGGGSYSVAKHNLGEWPSLVAGAGLVVGYVLTVAVSASSGTAALTSAFPDLLPFKVPFTVGFIFLLMLGNLRGLRESSVAFGLPTYFFMASALILIITGFVKAAVFGLPDQAIAVSTAQTSKDVMFFLVLRAFASGCSALTGVEAVSNSVPNFVDPAQRHAKKTLLLIGLCVLVIFGGISILAAMYHVTTSDNVTVISQIAATVFGGGTLMYFVFQMLTTVILLFAANTAFNGLPQLMNMLALDSFAPRRFAMRGTRLVYSSGIIFAALAACILVVVYGAETHLLVPLYSLGVFLSFTIAQVGMFRHWIKGKEAGWKHKATINGLGATVTATATVVVCLTKFTQGAWVALVGMAVVIVFFKFTKDHYTSVANSLRFKKGEARKLIFTQVPVNHVIVPLSTVNRSFVKAINYAMGLGDEIEVYHVSTDATCTAKVAREYASLGLPYPLVVDTTAYRNVNEMLEGHVNLRAEHLDEHETITVVMSQLTAEHWWEFILHNQTSIFLERAFMNRRDVAVVMLPYLIEG